MKKIWTIIREEEPVLIIGSPCCTAFCALQRLSEGKGDVGLKRELKRKAVEYITLCCLIFEYQVQIGTVYPARTPTNGIIINTSKHAKSAGNGRSRDSSCRSVYVWTVAARSKGGVKLSIHFCADGDTIETVFRTIISVNQLSTHGAVSDLCEEYSSCQTRTGRPVLAEQSDPLFAPADLLITAPTPSIEIPARGILLQKHKERVEKLPQPDRLIKICTDAGFLKTVEVGQYFMTKHTDEFLQSTEPVTCREYTLPRDK